MYMKVYFVLFLFFTMIQSYDNENNFFNRIYRYSDESDYPNFEEERIEEDFFDSQENATDIVSLEDYPKDDYYIFIKNIVDTLLVDEDEEFSDRILLELISDESFRNKYYDIVNKKSVIAKEKKILNMKIDAVNLSTGYTAAIAGLTMLFNLFHTRKMDNMFYENDFLGNKKIHIFWPIYSSVMRTLTFFSSLAVVIAYSFSIASVYKNYNGRYEENNLKKELISQEETLLYINIVKKIYSFF